MQTRTPLRRPWCVAVHFACAAALAVLSPTVLAANPENVTIDRMRIATDRAGVLSVKSGRVLPHREIAGAASLGYENDPLVLHRLGDRRRVGSLVGDRTSGVLGAAVGILDRGELAIEVPVVFQRSRQSGSTTPRSADAFGVGSVRLVPKLALLEEGLHGVDVAVLTGFDLPLGAGEFVGSELTFRPEIAASRQFGEMRVAINVGATIRNEASLLDATMGNELSGQVGAAYDLDARWGLPLEAGVVLASAVSASNPFGRSDETSAELRGYGAYDLGATRLLAGGGAGIESGWGTPDWRIFAGAQFGLSRRPVAFAAAAPPAPPAEPVTVAPPPPPVVPADPDRDGDGVLDRDDECPDLPGVPEHRGCRPQVAVRLVKHEPARIEFDDTIHFDFASDVIQPRSDPLLDAIAAVIDVHPEIMRIRVEGHTDSKGGRAYNQALSERRARSVVRALIARGIAAERLEPAGHGLDRPIADNATSAGRAKNRRVELRVLDERTAGTNDPGSLR